MIHILLMILKIIGIILLVILGILLVLILAVLFVPVRYKADFSWHGEPDLSLKASWFLHLLSFRAIYTKEGLKFVVRVLGINLLRKHDRDALKDAADAVKDGTEDVLGQEEQIAALCVKNSEKALEVNLCVPRATYISYAFSDFLKHMDSCPSVNVHYMETNSRDTIRGVSGKTFDVGIIRCQALYESYYMKLLQDENLEWKELWQFSCNVLMSPSHPLASRDKLTYLDFTDYIEIVQGDIQNPSFTFEAQDASATGGNSKKTVSIYDRGSQFELLRQLPGSYMWTSPVPYGCLTSSGLIQKTCSYPGNIHKDLLIYRNGYRFSKEEEEFLRCLSRMVSRLSD